MIKARDQYTCAYCGGYGNTIDHLKPKSKGGIASFKNCICACQACNQEKSDIPLEEYVADYKPIIRYCSEKNSLNQKLDVALEMLKSVAQKEETEVENLDHTLKKIYTIAQTIEKLKGKGCRQYVMAGR